MPVHLVDHSAQTSSGPSAKKFFKVVKRAVARAEMTGEGVIRLAFDCEGVRLSRIGTIELVTLVFEDSQDPGMQADVFVVDVGTSGPTSLKEERLAALKQVFECRMIEKVIHDCRMDCDALYHHCGIEVHNVHDTVCFHAILSGISEKSLNDVLSYNGLSPNPTRDSNVYKYNPTFWATRPLTAPMLQRASADVDRLLELARHQRSAATPSLAQQAKKDSENFAVKVKNMRVEQRLVLKVNTGSFIGKRGSNIRALRNRTGTLIYQDAGNNTWFVFYDSPSALFEVKRAMGY